MDDAGLYLLKQQGEGAKLKIQHLLGAGLLAFAPRLMKSLTYIGTVAMFLVGGGIIVHGFAFLAPLAHSLEQVSVASEQLNIVLNLLLPALFSALVGITAGGILLMVHSGIDKLKAKS